jgi:hypothetical protein
MQRPVIEIPNQSSRYVSNKEDPSISLFLGQENRENVQRLIIKRVYDKTSGKARIGRQSDTELQVVMIQTLQSQYNHHLPIAELNKIVINKCADNIINNIGYYMQYINDLNAPGPLGASQTALELIVPQNTRDSKERSFKSIF